jgi:hypothetical protein
MLQRPLRADGVKGAVSERQPVRITDDPLDRGRPLCGSSDQRRARIDADHPPSGAHQLGDAARVIA